MPGAISRRPGRVLTGTVVPDSRGAELPLRVNDLPGGALVRCLCGAEAAVMSPGITDLWLGRADPSAAGLLRMVLHAQRCLIGKNLAAEQAQAARAR